MLRFYARGTLKGNGSRAPSQISAIIEPSSVIGVARVRSRKCSEMYCKRCCVPSCGDGGTRFTVRWSRPLELGSNSKTERTPVSAPARRLEVYRSSLVRVGGERRAERSRRTLPRACRGAVNAAGSYRRSVHPSSATTSCSPRSSARSARSATTWPKRNVLRRQSSGSQRPGSMLRSLSCMGIAVIRQHAGAIDGRTGVKLLKLRHHCLGEQPHVAYRFLMGHSGVGEYADIT